MKKAYNAIFLVLCMGVFACNGQTEPNNNKAVAPAATNKEADNSKIQWLTFEEAVEKNKQYPKQIFIDFYTDWCGWCKVMDRNTFTDPEVIRLMNNHFYAVKFNAESKEPVMFNGKQYNFVPQGNRGYHELAASIMQGEMSYPTFIFLNEKFEIVTPVKGYVAPREFEPIVSFLGLRVYEGTETFDSYKANYKSVGPENPPVMPAAKPAPGQ